MAILRNIMSRSVAAPSLLSREQEGLVTYHPQILVERELRDILYGAPPKIQSTTACKVTHTVLKLMAAAACYAATFANLESSRRNFDDPIFREIVAYADSFAWGTVSVWSAWGIYRDMIEKGTIHMRARTKCLMVTHWIGVVFLGLVSMLPTTYTTYHYNESLFWTIYTPLILSFFSMVAIHETFDAVFVHHNFASRLFCPRRPKVELSLAQHNLHKIFDYSSRALSDERDFIFESGLLALNDGSKKDARLMQEALLKLMERGLSHREDIQEERSKKCPLIRSILKAVAIPITLATPIMDGIFINAGYREIRPETWPLPFIIALAVVPSFYLLVKMDRDFAGQAYDGVTSCACRNFSAREWATWIVTLLLTTCGLSTDVTFARDFVGFDNFGRAAISALFLCVIGVVLITTIQEMAEEVTDFFQKRKRNVQEIQYDVLVEKVDALSIFFKYTRSANFLAAMQVMGFGDHSTRDLSTWQITHRDLQQMLTDLTHSIQPPEEVMSDGEYVPLDETEPNFK